MKHILSFMALALLLLASHYTVGQSRTVRYLSKSLNKEVAAEDAYYVEVKVKNAAGGGTRTLYLAQDSSQVSLFSYSDIENGNYGRGVLDGPFYEWQKGGKLKAQGTYKNGKLEGDYSEWYESGQEQYKMAYNEGMLQDTLFGYYENGSLRRQEIYREGKMISGNLYSEDGKEIDFFPRMKMPEFPGGEQNLIHWLGNNIKYPKSVREDGAQGIVLISFIVGKNGKVSEAEVIKGFHPDADAEGLRIVKRMPHWKPGLEEGEPVAVKYTLPVKFSLSR